MKITVELASKEVREICHLTGIPKMGPALRRMITDSLLLKRRTLISEKFLSNEWSAELEGFEAAKVQDRGTSQSLAELWRD